MQDRAADQVLDLSQPTGEPDSSRDNENEALIPVDPAPAASCMSGVKARHLKRAAHLFPFSAAVSEGVETAIDLLGKPTALSVPVIIVNAVCAFGINEKFKNDSLEDAFQIINKRGIPEDWPKLTCGKEAFAIGTSSAMSLYTAFCDGAVTVHYSFKFPAIYNIKQHINIKAWNVSSIIFGIVRGTGVGINEGMETWQTTRGVLAGTKPEYANTLSRILSPTLGFTIAAFGSFDDAVLTCTSMVDVFEISSFNGRVAFTAASSVNGFTDYCMNGTFVIEVLKIVIENTAQNCKNPKVVAAFFLSLSSGLLAAYVYQGLVVEAMEEWLDLFGIDHQTITGPIIEVCADLGAASTAVNAGGSIFPIFRKGIDWVCSGASYIYSKISCCIHTDDDFFVDAQNEPEAVVIDIESLLVSLASSPIDIPVNDPLVDDKGKDEMDDNSDDDDAAFVDANDYFHQPDNLTFHFSEEEAEDEASKQPAFFDAWSEEAEFVEVSLSSSGESIPVAATRATGSPIIYRLFTHVPTDHTPSDDEKAELGYRSI